MPTPDHAAALKAELYLLKAAGADDFTKRASIARFTLGGDLGEHTGAWESHYDLDEPTRDRLIAHARQDASHAVTAAERAVSDIRKLQLVGWVIVALLAYIAWKV